VNVLCVNMKCSGRKAPQIAPHEFGYLSPLAFLLDGSKRLHCRVAKARIDALWLLLPSVGEATSTCADGCGHSSRAMKR
jgi:hypothetical protein